MARILNTILSAMGIFLLTLLWVAYCTKEQGLSVGLAAIVAVAAGYIVFRAQEQLGRGRKRRRGEAKTVAKLACMLRYGENNAALFCEVLRYFRFAVQVLDGDNIIVQKEGNTGYVALRYLPDTVNREEMARCVVTALRQGCGKLYLFAHKVDSAALKEANDKLPTVHVDDANLYALLVQSSKLPPLQQKPRQAQRLVPKVAFCRKRFGWYFAASLFMLAVSAVSLIKWYTLSWATVSLMLALYSLLNKRYNTPPTAVTLD